MSIRVSPVPFFTSLRGFKMNTSSVTAQNCSLFEIDAELEEAFDQLQEEREITGTISYESRERSVQLFANSARRSIASRHTCEPSSAKPALQPRKHSGCSNAAGQPSSGSTT